jgi:hypothetical protein
MYRCANCFLGDYVYNTGGVARANVPFESGGSGWRGRRVVIGEQALGGDGA